MAQPTPPSGVRGIWRKQAPSRLTYRVLGNPTDFQGQSYGMPLQQVADPYRSQIENPHGSQVGVPQGNLNWSNVLHIFLI